MTKNMTFIEHLSEFRKRLIFISIIFIISFILCYINNSKILSLCLKPVRQVKIMNSNSINFVFISPLELFFTKIKLSFWFSIFFCLPVIIFHILRFVFPGLTKKEKKYIYFAIPPSIILFLSGLLIAYFIIIPAGMYFLIASTTHNVKPMFSIAIYTDFFIIFEMITGIIFNIPIVILLLGKIGLISKNTLTNNRKFAILIIFVLSAVLTPPDVVTQIILALPIIILYEISIVILKIF